MGLLGCQEHISTFVKTASAYARSRIVGYQELSELPPGMQPPSTDAKSPLHSKWQSGGNNPPAVLPAITTVLHLLISSNMPSVAFYVVESSFSLGFESYLRSHSFNGLLSEHESNQVQFQIERSILLEHSRNTMLR